MSDVQLSENEMLLRESMRDKEILEHRIEILRERADLERKTGHFAVDPRKAPEMLKARLDRLSKKYTFHKGDVVRWKTGLKNKKRPAENEPAIVVEVLVSALSDPSEKSAGSPYFREPLDIMLGVIDEDGHFLTFYYDSRRFEPFDATASPDQLPESGQ